MYAYVHQSLIVFPGLFSHMCMHIFRCYQSRMCVCAYIFTHIHIQIYLYPYSYINIYIYKYTVYIYVCIYIYTYAHQPLIIITGFFPRVCVWLLAGATNHVTHISQTHYTFLRYTTIFLCIFLYFTPTSYTHKTMRIYLRGPSLKSPKGVSVYIYQKSSVILEKQIWRFSDPTG